jgi:putative flippase GtrA
MLTGRDERAAARARAARAARGERFGAVMAAATGRLPLGLARVVPPLLLGFAVLSAVTFSADLALLTALHGGLQLPLAASITLAYAAASGLGYALNRALNFRSHAAIGPQLARYAVVVVINYLAVILGVTDGLATAGVDYRLARLTAGACEAAWMYAAMRWLIFRDAVPAGVADGPDAGGPDAGGPDAGGDVGGY